MKLGNKIFYASGALAVFLTILGITSWSCLHNSVKSNALVMHTIDVLKRLDLIVLRCRECESSGRGYIITSEESFHDAFNSYVADVANEYNRTKELIINPEQKQSMSELGVLLDTKINTMKTYVHNKEIGDLKSALKGVVQGRNSMTQIEELVDKMTERELDLLRTRKDALEENIHNTFASIVMGTLLAIAFFILSGFLLTRIISGSINKIMRAVERVNSGKFDSSVWQQWDDEFDELAQSLIETSHNLRSAIHTANEEKKSREHLQDLLNKVRDHLTNIDSLANDLLYASDQHASNSENEQTTISNLTNKIKELEENSKELLLLASNITDQVANIKLSNDSGRATFENIFTNIKSFDQSYQHATNDIESLSKRISELVAIATTIDDIATRINPITITAVVESSRASKNNGAEFQVLLNELRAISESSTQAKGKVQQSLFDVQNIANKASSESDKITEKLNIITDSMGQLSTALDTLPNTVKTTHQNASKLAEAISSIGESLEHLKHNVDKVQLLINEKNSFVKLATDKVSKLNDSKHEVDKLLNNN